MKRFMLLAAVWIVAGCGKTSSGGSDAVDPGVADPGPDAAVDAAGEVATDPGDPGGFGDEHLDPPAWPSYRVMTFNVMCPVCDSWYDPWEKRLQYFGDVFARHGPALVGIQEPMVPADVDEILSVAPGYAAVFYAGDATYLPYPDATILYRTDRFDLKDSGSFWLSPTPEEPWSLGFADGQAVPRVVVWAKLWDRDAGRGLFFATTHFDSTDPHQERSAPLVLERLATMAELEPVVFVGDLNSEPFHPAYGILTGRSGGPGFHLADAFVLAPAWHVDANTEPAPDYDPAGRIDHILVAGGAWSCTDWWADLYEYGAGPKFPSDHRAVVADLALDMPAWAMPDAVEAGPDAAGGDVPAEAGADVASADAVAVDTVAGASCPAGFVPVPAGHFDMGSPDGEPGRGADEGPVHAVTISKAFCLQATEVTQAEWQSLMGNNPSSYADCGASCPVEQVGWLDALAYCNALSAKEGLAPCYGLTGCAGTPGDRYECSGVTFAGPGCAGYRLPTEAEWEYAARAGGTAATYGGQIDAAHLACEEPDAVLDGIAWTCGTVWTSPKPVASKQPNAWGLYDMLGNVWEWVWDRYGAYAAAAATDPTGPQTGPWRVFRGGAWDAEARYARAAARYHDIPGAGVNDLGFRPALTP